MLIKDCIGYLEKYKQPIKIMEVCGTHTSGIVKNGIRDLLPSNMKLVSGPGCPVCVTETGYIDSLIAFSLKINCCVLSFGDLFKVRGSSLSFTEAQAQGASFHVIYSPIDAALIAKSNPHINYVIAAVGFETTIPLYALLIESLRKDKIKNLKIACSLKTMIPAMSFICEKELIDGFICPGHVSVIIGSGAFEKLAARYNKPFIITGFEPEYIIAAIYEIITQINESKYQVKNLYNSVVIKEGNLKALELIDRYFTSCDGYWRGIGVIEKSALTLRGEYFDFFMSTESFADENIPNGCRCADVLLGRITPQECELFGKSCRRDNPIGACMTSQEGACSIWHGSMAYSESV